MKTKTFLSKPDIFLTTSPGKTTLVMPIKIVSENNLSEHWTKKHRRHVVQKKTVKYYFSLLEDIPHPPCHIILTRISPRLLDFDNLTGSLKWILDAVCDQLIPGLKPGRADGDKRLSFEYQQKKGLPRQYGIQIEIVDK
jgi:hypothetical protein